jgi:hypothetical protein
MHVKYHRMPESIGTVISANKEFLESLLIHAAADPYGGWDAMISNFIEGGVLHLIAADYKVQRIGEVAMLDGVRRSLRNGRYSVCLAFEAVVQVRCEAFQFERRPPQPRPDSPSLTP